jgi:hypothetical protein
MEPFRMMTTREENKRLREEGHAAPHSHTHTSQHEPTPSDNGERGSKRAKTTPGDNVYDAADRLKKKGDTSAIFLDPVQLGLVTEEQGRGMFDR